MEQNNDENYKNLIYFGAHSEIIFADKTVAKSDYKELFRTADFFASIYGLGSHLSITSFVEMINDEDPLIVSGMYCAAIERLKKMYGVDKNKDTSMDDAINKNVGFKMNGSPSKIHRFDNNTPTDNQATLVQFLREWGATKQQIEEAKAKITSGQIKISSDDYSWINPESILRPGFDLKNAIRKLKEDYDNSYKIKVSLETREKREKDSK
jgi:hypothetical protein